MKTRRLLICLGLAPALAMAEPAARAPEDQARVAAVTAFATDFTRPEAFEANPAGAGSIEALSFRTLLPTLDAEAKMQATLGEAIFDKLWVAAPSATRASDGLGPMFNARSCAGCHPAGGRGAPDPNGISGLVAKLALPVDPGKISARHAAIAGWNPRGRAGAFGWQLNTRSLPELPPEGTLALDWETQVETLADGTEVTLHRPMPRMIAGAMGPLPEGTEMDLRIAPQMIGLGLLAAIPQADILAQEDPDDTDGDGISGRAAQVWSAAEGRHMIGRFGHKGAAGTLTDMAAGALFQDIGISSALFPDGAGDCGFSACTLLPDGEDQGLRDGHEISDAAVAVLADYSGALAVPKRRAPADPQVLRGKAAFYDAGCPACHRPKFVTARDAGDPARNFQLIWPYSDLLLHDMGEGLAGGSPEGIATRREWRTAPLWGIGLTAQVTGKPASYLHDGRAGSLLEAILWHGGEAQAARDKVAQMPRALRDDLIRFLESL